MTATLVTGGTGAIGAAIVTTLTAAGRTVAFTGRDETRARKLASVTGAKWVPHHDTHGGLEVLHETESRVGALDGLVLNAGAIVHEELLATGEQALRDLFEVNFAVPVRQARHAAQRMSPGGAIVAVASNAGLWPETPIGAYSLSKAMLLAAVRALAVPAAARGVRINAVAPGDTEPGMAATLARDGEPFELLPPLGRLGTAQDTADAVAFLLSERASFVAGTALLADGGMHAASDAGRLL